MQEGKFLKQYEVINIDPPYATVKSGDELFKVPVEAHLDTWQPLSENYSKDHKGILCNSSRVFTRHTKAIDLETFEVIQENDTPMTTYFRDKNNVYLHSSMCTFTTLEGAIPGTFEITDIKKGFSTDGCNDYYYAQPLPYRLTDARLLNEHYAEANGKIYAAYTRPVPADATTFVIPAPELISNVALDKDHVFFREEIVAAANPRTFHFLDRCVAADRDYYRNCDIEFYAKDEKFAWFVRTIDKSFKKISSKSIEAFDFKVEDETGYGYDKENRYRQGKKV
ncbi:DKNYY domain-containing protein [Chitinophaga eiseniae]|nr:DKNYY domain-containing protein [Chitinophaga eiseniae]